MAVTLGSGRERGGNSLILFSPKGAGVLGRGGKEDITGG